MINKINKINIIIVILLVIVLGLILYIKKLNKHIDQFVDKKFKSDKEIETKLYEITKHKNDILNKEFSNNKKLENFNKLNKLEDEYAELIMGFKTLFQINTKV